MEAIVLKTGESIGRRRTGNGEPSGRRCVKRGRRDSTASSVSVSCDDKRSQLQPVVDQTSSSPATTTVKRSSRFRGVSRHRWTGRFEAHLWDKLSWNVTQKKKGKQVYLGAYDEEESAARAYDLAALKYWGTSTFTNFPIPDYEKEIEIMQTVTKEEYLASLRRRSSGFSRGVSKYRGVARHHHNGRWEARIGRVFGNKYLYLGTYTTQEEAGRAYDIAAIEYKGINAVTNFDLSNYIRWLKPGESVSIASHDQSKLPLASNFFSGEQPKQSVFPINLLRTDSLSPKQDVYERELPNKSSSPTALSLLLRSSVFRELVEKNSNLSEDDTDGEDLKNQVQMGGDANEDLFAGIFCDGPFIALQERELQYIF